MKTILVTVSDDRFGRKNGLYKTTQNKISKIFNNNFNFGFSNIFAFEWEGIKLHKFYQDNKVLLDNKDAARNGRAYKPYVILEAMKYLNDGDFLIYNDCSPELWNFFKEDYIVNPIYNLKIIQDLCINNNDIFSWLKSQMNRHIRLCVYYLREIKIH